MRLDPVAADWDFPRSAGGLRVLVSYAATRGVPAARALAGTGLSPDRLGDGSLSQVTAAQELRVVRTLRHLLGEVGAEVGLGYSAATFGAFGWGLLASRTVLDAMTFAVGFIDLSNAFALPRAVVADDEVRVELDAAGLPADVRRFLLERDTVAVRVVLDSLVPGGVGATTTWGTDGGTLTFRADQLARPLPERSAERLALAATMCEEIVAARRTRTGLAHDVRVLITQQLAAGAPMEAVASALAMTERTLRRRLAQEGASYRSLLEEVRSSMAEALLGGAATMPLAEVAARLGYGSAAALAHARARWAVSVPSRDTDTTPPRP